jgi:hypothetical protein
MVVPDSDSTPILPNSVVQWCSVVFRTVFEEIFTNFVCPWHFCGTFWGLECGTLLENKTCDNGECPVDCELSDWGAGLRFASIFETDLIYDLINLISIFQVYIYIEIIYAIYMLFLWFRSFLILNCWYFTMSLDIPWGEWSPCDRSCKTESEPGIRGPGTTYFSVKQCHLHRVRSKIIVKKLKWRKWNGMRKTKQMYIFDSFAVGHLPCARKAFPHNCGDSLGDFQRASFTSLLHWWSALRTEEAGNELGKACPMNKTFWAQLRSSPHIFTQNLHQSPHYLHNSSQFFSILHMKIC